MELKILEVDHQIIAEVIADEVVINDDRDALDMMVNAGYLEAQSVIMHEKHLNEGFFDLRTGMAGEILQKYANYNMKLVVVGDFEKYQSNSLNAFIMECNRGNLAFFVPDRETAIGKIAGQ